MWLLCLSSPWGNRPVGPCSCLHCPGLFSARRQKSHPASSGFTFCSGFPHPGRQTQLRKTNRTLWIKSFIPFTRSHSEPATSSQMFWNILVSSASTHSELCSLSPPSGPLGLLGNRLLIEPCLAALLKCLPLLTTTVCIQRPWFFFSSNCYLQGCGMFHFSVLFNVCLQPMMKGHLFCLRYYIWIV